MGDLASWAGLTGVYNPIMAKNVIHLSEAEAAGRSVRIGATL